MFKWTPEMIGFMRDADGYGDFHRALARHLTDLLGPRTHVCDAGCGTGELACELARHCASVTAVDISGLAIHQLRLSADARGLRNLHAVCGDIADCAPETPYDAMTFCFFGSVEEILKTGAAQCRGTLAVVMKDYPNHRFSIGTQPLRGHTAPLAAARLEALGVPFRLAHLTLEMGQPFRTLADAVRFFRIYSRDENPDEITPEQVERRLLRTGRPDFPYYLPGERRMGIFQIETDSLTTGGIS